MHGYNDLMVMIKFESIFDITEETYTNDFSTVKSSSSLSENSRIIRLLKILFKNCYLFTIWFHLQY